MTAAGAGPGAGGAGEAAHVAVAILLLHYLLTADGVPPAGAWSAYRELPDGMFYAFSFMQRAEQPVARAFAASPEGLDGFRAAARALGGDALTLGDASFRFVALPRVDVAVLVWAGDDEEPGEARVLFDGSAGHYLPAEDLAGLGGQIAHRLPAAAAAEVRRRPLTAGAAAAGRRREPSSVSDLTMRRRSMFVRIARFEGGTAAQIEEEGSRIRRDLEAARSGEPGPEIPSELALLARRIEMLVDRERGAVVVLIYAETEAQAREIDRIMDQMSPSSAGWGRRVRPTCTRCTSTRLRGWRRRPERGSSPAAGEGGTPPRPAPPVSGAGTARTPELPGSRRRPAARRRGRGR